MNVASRRERIAAQLADLKMPGALEALDEVLSGVDGGGITASEAIERLLATQIALRNSRRLEAAMRSSRLPTIKTLSEFDFSFQPSIKREQIDSLHELGFVARRENIVFLGPPGVGKTHLAISLAIAAAERGRRVDANHRRGGFSRRYGRTLLPGEVRKGGLEPPRGVTPPDPKSGASANSATFAVKNHSNASARSTRDTICCERSAV